MHCIFEKYLFLSFPFFFMFPAHQVVSHQQLWDGGHIPACFLVTPSYRATDGEWWGVKGGVGGEEEKGRRKERNRWWEGRLATRWPWERRLRSHWSWEHLHHRHLEKEKEGREETFQKMSAVRVQPAVEAQQYLKWWLRTLLKESQPQIITQLYTSFSLNSVLFL